MCGTRKFKGAAPQTSLPADNKALMSAGQNPRGLEDGGS